MAGDAQDRVFHGALVVPEFRWVVMVRGASRYGPEWYPLGKTFLTRSAAIADFDTAWTQPGEYRRRRRRGVALAVRCVVKPLLGGLR